MWKIEPEEFLSAGEERNELYHAPCRLQIEEEEEEREKKTKRKLVKMREIGLSVLVSWGDFSSWYMFAFDERGDEYRKQHIH